MTEKCLKCKKFKQRKDPASQFCSEKCKRDWLKEGEGDDKVS